MSTLSLNFHSNRRPLEPFYALFSATFIQNSLILELLPLFSAPSSSKYPRFSVLELIFPYRSTKRQTLSNYHTPYPLANRLFAFKTMRPSVIQRSGAKLLLIVCSVLNTYLKHRDTSKTRKASIFVGELTYA